MSKKIDGKGYPVGGYFDESGAFRMYCKYASCKNDTGAPCKDCRFVTKEKFV